MGSPARTEISIYLVRLTTGAGSTRLGATRTSTAIVALIAVFVFAPAAVVLGHIAKSQIRRTGEHGSGLATIALVLGYVITALSLWALLVILPEFMNRYYEISHITVPTP